MAAATPTENWYGLEAIFVGVQFFIGWCWLPQRRSPAQHIPDRLAPRLPRVRGIWCWAAV